MKEEIQQQLTQQRINLSAIEQKLGKPSREESTLALRSVQMASMWLGKCLGALGTRTPYKESFDPNSDYIEKRADQAEPEEEKKSSKKEDEIKQVKELRVELNKLENDLYQNVRGYEDRAKYQEFAKAAYLEICKATMWMGQTLNAIRLESNSDEFLTEPTVVTPADQEEVPQEAKLELTPTTDKKIIEHQKKADEKLKEKKAEEKKSQGQKTAATDQPKSGETKMSPNPQTKNSKHGR